MERLLQPPSGLMDKDIPPSWVDAHTNDVAILLWVRNGAITFTAESIERRVPAGKAIWVPAGIEHGLRSERGTVFWAAPAYVPKHRAELAQVRVVDIPPAWGDWLIHKRDFYRVDTEDVPLLALAIGQGGQPEPPASLPQLPMPRSPEAHAVARDLLRSPGSPLSVDELAARQRISAKTLQRQFAGETGVAFSEWRTRARVRAAAARLADGHQIATTRRHVGYATATGFTRAFQRHVGLTPRDYVHHARSSGATAAAEETAANVAALAAEEHRPPPPIPAGRGQIWVNDCHLLSWLYRGEATIRIGHHDRHLSRGDAIWLPAGVPYQIDLAAESIIQALGIRHRRVRTDVNDLKVFTFPPEAETYLLYVYCAELGLTRSDEPPTLVDDLFREQFRHEIPGGSMTGAVGTVAAALHRNPADARSLAEWAKALNMKPTALGREFTTQTGTTFPRWRAQMRMSIARNLLYMGERPSIIARQLGYARLVSFTKVFTATHGVPPREYVRREVDRWAEDADQTTAAGSVA